MKILIINTFERTGGAAVAAGRLRLALNKNSMEVKMLVRDKQTDDINVVSINNGVWKQKINFFRFMWERLVIFAANKFSKKNLFYVSIANTGTDISSHPLVKKADIIHLHWINQGFLSLKDIEKLTKLGKPVVWTMHDMWPCTGICHHAGTCNKFAQQCGQCPQLINPKLHDLSRKVFNNKNRFTKNIDLVGCSKWIAEEAKKSKIVNPLKITSIPNPINTKVYRCYEKSSCRQELLLPIDKKLILFGACKVTDKRKGIDYMIDVCKILINNNTYSIDDLAIVIFGGNSNEIASLLTYPVVNIGYIDQAEKMIRLYNAVDLFVTPSLEENLPNTIMEAMACGTPCVGFDIGGIPEMIDHKKNGYIAEYKNSDDLAKGISWVLKESDINELSKNARKKVEENYAEDIVAKQYIDLYKRLLKQ